DVIIFVGDSARARWDLTLEYLLELRQIRDDNVGIVFQANKRDFADAVPLDEIRARLGDGRWDIGTVESVAADGTGIREAFVYGVRLALDRVREQTTRGMLREGRPEHMSPADLLAHMQRAELTALRGADLEDTIERAIEVAMAAPPTVESNPQSLAAALIQEVLAAEVDATPVLPPIPTPRRFAAPRPPDASVPSGAIWPPVEGRTILLEVAQIELVPRRHNNGDWSAGLGTGWRLVSKRDAHFESLDIGRNALVQWARLHAACTSILSPRRCIVLAATGDGRWRLWQIVRAEESLRELVERSSPQQELIDSLCQTAQLLVEVHERLATAPCELPCRLDTIGACDASGMYIGLMPEMPVEPTRPRLSAAALLASELGPILALDLAEHRAALGRALSLRSRQSVNAILDSLQRLLVPG
ncbi:MAG TPA: hypothetical protein VIU61_27720, partial [Kofleriaceae bacterium]